MATRSENIWSGSALLKKLLYQKETGLQTPRLLLTDIDGTFIDKMTEHGHDEPAKELIEYLNSHSYGLVAVTGRDLSMMMRDYKKGILPLFDVIITAVGTERYVLTQGKYVKDTAYADYIEHTLKFDRAKVHACCTKVVEQIRQLQRQKGSTLKNVNLAFQPRDRYLEAKPKTVKFPQPYKISFNFFGDEKVTKKIQTLFRLHFGKEGLKGLKLVFSVDSRRNGKIRNNLDVVPIEKDGAANVFIKDIEEMFGKVFGIYAGDSMNDYQAIRLAGHAAIVVGGADPFLLKKLKKLQMTATARSGAKQSPIRYLYIEGRDLQKGPTSLLAGVKSLEALLIGKVATNDIPGSGYTIIF